MGYGSDRTKRDHHHRSIIYSFSVTVKNVWYTFFAFVEVLRRQHRKVLNKGVEKHQIENGNLVF
jgi:hypothetical protein